MKPRDLLFTLALGLIALGALGCVRDTQAGDVSHQETRTPEPDTGAKPKLPERTYVWLT